MLNESFVTLINMHISFIDILSYENEKVIITRFGEFYQFLHYILVKHMLGKKI